MTHPWIRRTLDAAFPEGDIPLFGNAPPFPWDTFSSLLAKALSIPSLTLRPGTASWSDEEIPSSHLLSSIDLSPLSAPFYWAMGKQDIETLTTWTLNGKTFSSEILQEGYYRYLLLEALHAAQSLEPIQQMTLSLSDDRPLAQGTHYLLNIELSLNGRSCWGKLLFTREFQRQWIQHFSSTPLEYRPSLLSNKTHLSLSLTTASTTLLPKELKRLKKGDFLCLDTHGSHTLFLNQTPLFQVKINGDQLELLDYAPILEVPMQDHSDNLDATEEEAISIKEIPLQVTVELARIPLTLDRILHLSPGDTLDLAQHPDQPVTLTVNGQKIGTGELLSVGETLGVRLLSIG